MPGLMENLGLNNRRKAFRSEPNPLDKCTVVSIYPRDIHDVSWTIQPSHYDMKAGSIVKPSIMVVGSASWWKEMEDGNLFEVINSSIQVASGFILNWASGMLECDMADNMPGLFYVLGAKTSADILKDHKDLLAVAEKKQKNWYEKLVLSADSLWISSNGHPKVISDQMKMAAREIGMEDRDWMSFYQNIAMIKCVACGNLRNPNFPICGNCKTVIDKAKAKELGLIA